MRIIRAQKAALKLCFRLYCSDKPTKALDKAQKIDKKSDIIQQPSEISTEEACAKFEERVLKQVLIEKEQDANLQSRISKDCRIIFGGTRDKAPSIKCGAIRLDQITLQKDSPEWISYNFDSKNSIKIAPPVTTKTGSSSTLGVQMGNVAAGSKSGGTGANNPMRPVRQEPGKVLLTFIPEEWWRAFIPKTGVTGFGTFLFTFATFIVSKEYYVLEHEYYSGISWFIMWAFCIKYFGPKVAEQLNKELDAFEKSWNEGREQTKQMLEDSIVDELHVQFQADGELLINEAKRENVLLQLEEEYRKRQMYAYEEVKRRLDYYVAVEQIKQRMQHRNLIEYVTREVIKSITPEIQQKLIYYSIDQIMQEMEADKNKK